MIRKLFNRSSVQSPGSADAALPGAELELDPATFQRFCDLIYAKAGIKLGEKKEALVSARLGKRLRSLKLGSYEEYFDLVERDPTGNELVEMLNVISTNVTHFFRESRHFDLLGELVRGWEARGQRQFRIWCAASSTGEEPYTIAITLKESLKDTSGVKILATDISTKVLAIARTGVYREKIVGDLPAAILSRYFTMQRSPEGEKVYAVQEDLKRMLTFARLNLAEPPFPMKGPFDVILCRNVMIYFDNRVRSRLLAEAYRLVRPGGYLMVGHAESLSGMISDFTGVEPSVYTKK